MNGRVAALDGLRGIAIVLVILGHSWLIWPMDEVTSIPVLRGPFLGGTVTVFFVIGGFVVTRGLLRELDRGTCDPLRFYLRRLVRLGPQLVLVCVAVLVLARLDPASGSPEDTRASVLHVLTFTWNVYLEQDALDARGDLGHLWYLSVQQQAYLLLPLVLVLFARARTALMLLLALATVLVVVERARLLGEVGFWIPSLRTTTRADGLLLGVLVALLLPRLRDGGRWARPALALGITGMIALILVAGEVGEYQYLGWWGVAVMLVSGLLVAAVAAHPGGTGVRALGFAPLRAMGRGSYTTYVWHFPLFWFISRHTPDWAWPARVLLAVGVLVVLVLVLERFVEEPLRRTLRTGRAFRIAEPVR